MVDSICCKDITIPPGNQSLVEDRLFNGTIAELNIVFVGNDAFHGSHDVNPYNFKHMTTQ